MSGIIRLFAMRSPDCVQCGAAATHEAVLVERGCTFRQPVCGPCAEGLAEDGWHSEPLKGRDDR